MWAGRQERGTRARFPMLPVPLDGLVCGRAGVPLPDLLFHVLLLIRPRTSRILAAKAAAAPLPKRAQALLKSPRDLGALAASTAPGYWSVALYHGGGGPMPSSPRW